MVRAEGGCVSLKSGAPIKSEWAGSQSRGLADTNPHSSMFIHTFSKSIRISHVLP